MFIVYKSSSETSHSSLLVSASLQRDAFFQLGEIVEVGPQTNGVRGGISENLETGCEIGGDREAVALISVGEGLYVEGEGEGGGEQE